MRKAILLLAVLFAWGATAQNKTIRLNTEFILELTTSEEGHAFDFRIVETRPYTDFVDMMDITERTDLLNPGPGQIHGIFGIVKFDEFENPFLCLRSGMAEYLKISVMALSWDKPSNVQTYNLELNPGVLRGDLFRGDLDAMRITGFSVADEPETPPMLTE